MTYAEDTCQGRTSHIRTSDWARTPRHLPVGGGRMHGIPTWRHTWWVPQAFPISQSQWLQWPSINWFRWKESVWVSNSYSDIDAWTQAETQSCKRASLRSRLEPMQWESSHHLWRPLKDAAHWKHVAFKQLKLQKKTLVSWRLHCSDLWERGWGGGRPACNPHASCEEPFACSPEEVLELSVSYKPDLNVSAGLLCVSLRPGMGAMAFMACLCCCTGFRSKSPSLPL